MSTAQTLNGAFAAVSNLDPGPARGAFVFDTPFADLNLAVATQSGANISIAPNFNFYADNPGDAFWRDNGGAGPGGNKWVDMSAFENTLVLGTGTMSEQTFTACVNSNTLASGYTTTAFIRVFAEDYSALFGEVTAPATGSIELSIPLAGDVNVQVQKGFLTSGPNANPADAATVGTVEVTVGAACAAAAPAAGSGGPVSNVPVLPIWALVLLAGVVGLFGARTAAGRKRG